VYKLGIGSNGSLGVKEKLESYDLKTRDLRLTFTAGNAAEGIEGDPVPWTNTIDVKYKLYGAPGARACELRALPTGAIRYTTDGASPSSGGHLYSGPFPVPPGCTVILAQASADGIVSQPLRIDVPKNKREGGDEAWRVDLTKPATWRKRHTLDSTSEVFTFLEHAIRRATSLGEVRVVAAKDSHWAELQFDKDTFLQAETVRDQATQLRDIIVGANVTLEIGALKFPDGRGLLDLTNDLKETPERHEVMQG
jgi:hypothetical protein